MQQTLRLMTQVVVLVMAGVGPFATHANEPRIDTVHEVVELEQATVRFQVKLFGLARLVGHFERLYGKLVHGDDPDTGQVHMQIEVSSVNTDDEWRDDYLRGPTFFDAERYPEISFSGTCLELGVDGRKRIVGELSLHGMTRPVAFDVEPAGSDNVYSSNRYQARTVIKRSEFGLNSLRHIVSDEVEITVAMHMSMKAGV